MKLRAEPAKTLKAEHPSTRGGLCNLTAAYGGIGRAIKQSFRLPES